MALFEVKTKKLPSNLLKDRFLVPPFTVLDTKQGYWQERKHSWINLGIKGELGRGEELLYGEGADNNLTFKNSYRNSRMAFTRTSGCTSPNGAEKFGRKAQQTSIFDPVLCEIMYKWFSVDGAKILDPFAGGSVRGMIAGMLGKHYCGVDLSTAQINANELQYRELSEKYDDIVKPVWINGDSVTIDKLISDNDFDMIFSCPPYYNLEIYSDKQEDLSNKSTYDDFLLSYEKIINLVCNKLKDDSFAIFVVSNIRDNFGAYYNFVGDTVEAFQKAGLIFYNDVILVNVAGTLPVRAPIQFNASRKLGKQHQNVLIFYKGNPKNIKNKFGNFEESNGTL